MACPTVSADQLLTALGDHGHRRGHRALQRRRPPRRGGARGRTGTRASCSRPGPWRGPRAAMTASPFHAVIDPIAVEDDATPSADRARVAASPHAQRAADSWHDERAALEREPGRRKASSSPTRRSLRSPQWPPRNPDRNGHDGPPHHYAVRRIEHRGAGGQWSRPARQAIAAERAGRADGSYVIRRSGKTIGSRGSRHGAAVLELTGPG